MRLIELHILQSFPVSCLNRDEVGAPKTAIFGGVQRARISSQCLKRAIRLWARQENALAFRGSRTRKAAEQLAEALAQPPYNWAAEEAKEKAELVCHLMLNKKAPKKKGKKGANAEAEGETEESTSTLLYFSPEELRAMASAMDEARKSGQTDPGKLKDAAVAALKKNALAKDAADIALFGRMVANAPDLTLEGAAMFSHALSTHPADNEIDFFAAVDDEKTLGEDAGAGLIGTNEFNSATYYRFIAVNLDMLADNAHLGGLSVDERREILRVFLRACLMALPDKGRKNSMNAWVLPSYVLGVAKHRGQPIQLVNAFEKPVNSGAGLVEKSVAALREHFASLKRTWNIETAEEVELPPADLETFCRTLVQHVI